MYLGIDIGTSRTKAAIVTETSRLVATDSIPTPRELLEPGSYLSSFVDELMRLILGLKKKYGSPESISVSAVSPALVVFCENDSPQLVFSHLTPTAIHYAQGGTLESRLDFRRRRTEDRLANAAASLLHRPEFFLPLASAVALMISGELVFDPINAYELGFASVDRLRDFCRLPGASPQSSSVWAKTASLIMHNGPIAVTTDSCASMIGSGLRQPSDGMIYYGTYHSALELNIPMLECLFGKELIDVPYYWHVSLPQYGRFLERFLVATTGESLVDAAFGSFQRALNSNLTLPASDSVRVWPELPEIVTSDTPLSVRIENLSISVNFANLAVALALPLGEAIRAKLKSGDLNQVKTWFAAGGGAQMRELVVLTSQVTGLCQNLRAGPGSARGAAMLASSVHKSQHDLRDDSEIEIIDPN